MRMILPVSSDSATEKKNVSPNLGFVRSFFWPVICGWPLVGTVSVMRHLKVQHSSIDNEVWLFRNLGYWI